MKEAERLLKIYESRPFKIRNADEFEIDRVLDLFVDPTEGLKSPFDFENSIIKGRMGTGKTMYLRANYAYYLSLVVPSLLEQRDVILPIYIRLSDYQSIISPEDAYNQIIVRIVQEITDSYLHFQESKKLALLHSGIKSISRDSHLDDRLRSVVDRLSQLTAEEYAENIKHTISGQAGLAPDFCSLSIEHQQEKELFIKQNRTPGISDITYTYNKLLKPISGKLLILFDEAGSLNKNLFKQGEHTSIFETILNQLRTLEYVRTKVAIYPQSYSDILTETRYGDSILLQETIRDDSGYMAFKVRALSIIEKYIAKSFGDIDSLENITVEHLFDVSLDNDEVIEQLINASDGNMRRYIHLLDNTMDIAYKSNHGTDRIAIPHVKDSLIMHARSMELQFSDNEQTLLHTIAIACKAKSTCRFRFPYNSTMMQKFANKSSEYNIINMVEPGSGRKAAVYNLDYAYCCYKDVPTHYLKGTEKIDRQRSRSTGVWIHKTTTLNDSVIEHASMPGKIEGTVSYESSDGNGVILGDDGINYFFLAQNIIDTGDGTSYRLGKSVRFLPHTIDKMMFAAYVEIL